MTYFALYRKRQHERCVYLRDSAHAAALVDLAQPGDTLHQFPLDEPEVSSQMVMELCEGQLANKEYKQL